MSRIAFFVVCLLPACGCGMQDEMQPMVAYERGLLQMREGNLEAALASFEEAAEKMPNEPLVRYDAAVALEQLNRYEDAMGMYSQCIELDPQFDRAYNNRAVIKARLGDHAAAVQDCDRAIELNRSDPFPYRNRGTSHAELGNYQQAIEDFTIAMKLSPEPSPATLLSRAEVCLSLQQFNSAHADVDEILRFDENYAPAHVLKGMIYRQQQKSALADACFARAREIDPQVPIPEAQEIVAAKPAIERDQAESNLFRQLQDLGYSAIQPTPEGPFSYSAMQSGHELSICLKPIVQSQQIRLSKTELEALRQGPVSLVVATDAGDITFHRPAWQPAPHSLLPVEFLYTLEN